MPEFYMIIARKIFFGIFFFGGGEKRAPCPLPSPTPMPKSADDHRWLKTSVADHVVVIPGWVSVRTAFPVRFPALAPLRGGGASAGCRRWDRASLHSL